jgi:hypothetical protein
VAVAVSPPHQARCSFPSCPRPLAHLWARCARGFSGIFYAHTWVGTPDSSGNKVMRYVVKKASLVYYTVDVVIFAWSVAAIFWDLIIKILNVLIDFYESNEDIPDLVTDVISLYPSNSICEVTRNRLTSTARGHVKSLVRLYLHTVNYCKPSLACLSMHATS